MRTEKDLSDREFQILQSELSQYNKSSGIAYVLWFFFGTLGVHKFYIGKIGSGVLYLLMWVFIGMAIVFMMNGITAAVIVPIFFGLMLLYDLFTIPNQIKSEREKRKAEIIKQIKSP